MFQFPASSLSLAITQLKTLRGDFDGCINLALCYAQPKGGTSGRSQDRRRETWSHLFSLISPSWQSHCLSAGIAREPMRVAPFCGHDCHSIPYVLSHCHLRLRSMGVCFPQLQQKQLIPWWEQVPERESLDETESRERSWWCPFISTHSHKHQLWSQGNDINLF